MKNLSLFCICALFVLESGSQNISVNEAGKNGRVLQLCFETLAHFFTDSTYANLTKLTKEKAVEYHIDEIRIGGIFFYDYLNLPDFPLIKAKEDKEFIASFRQELKWFKDNGMKVTIYVGGEPRLPGVTNPPSDEKSFFDFYPEARYLENGLLWKFLEERTCQLFRVFPEADALSFHLWETPLLDDLNYFTGIRWQKAHSWWAGPNQYYSHADYITHMVASFSRGATKAGKEISVLSFCHYPHQENLMIESFKELEKNDIPMLLVHKSQPGDWDPYRGPNNVMLQTSGRGMMLFDGVGEYWGGSRIPYCFPEEIQYRLNHALQNNKNLYSVAVRVFDFFDYGTLFGNYNEVNFYAVSRLVENPSVSTEQIWQEWAGKKFGKEAAPQMIEILKRSDEIGKLVYYFNGIWVQQHSLIAELNYMKAQVLHTGRAMLDWYPDRVIENGMIQEFMSRPNETLIQEAVSRREYALRLCNQSISDAKSVEQWLSRNEYIKLTQQLEVQRKFAEVSKLHIEAYLRYMIHRNDPGNQENIKRLILVLASLDKLAKEIDETWQEKERLLSGKRIRGFVTDIKKECHI